MLIELGFDNLISIHVLALIRIRLFSYFSSRSLFCPESEPLLYSSFPIFPIGQRNYIIDTDI